jgi:hypothetical protein
MIEARHLADTLSVILVGSAVRFLVEKCHPDRLSITNILEKDKHEILCLMAWPHA